ncbi:hypothetical protein ACIBG7_43095 [Nonomuraea sp. NPDC050328]|uniref:hypothetical protein n=1 Tax=Nonomuraea sp. NPDC050328 TaxID=3364361 RepID=UPI0037983568
MTWLWVAALLLGYAMIGAAVAAAAQSAVVRTIHDTGPPRGEYIQFAAWWTSLAAALLLGFAWPVTVIVYLARRPR